MYFIFKTSDRKLSRFLNRLEFLNDCQYDFRKEPNTTDVLLKFKFEAYNSLHGNSNLIAVFLDVSKAFGTVSIDFFIKQTWSHWSERFC